MNNPTLRHVKGAMHLHYLKIWFDRYVNQQHKFPTPSHLGATENMMCLIRDGDVV